MILMSSMMRFTRPENVFVWDVRLEERSLLMMALGLNTLDEDSLGPPSESRSYAAPRRMAARPACSGAAIKNAFTSKLSTYSSVGKCDHM